MGEFLNLRAIVSLHDHLNTQLMAASYPNKKQNQSGKRSTLRSGHAPAEAALWEHLQKKKLGGLKFLRQYEFGPYVLDYYCAEKLLAIQLDGTGQANEDERRTSYLAERGIRELHFDNRQIFEKTDEVLAAITEAAAATTPAGKEA